MIQKKKRLPIGLSDFKRLIEDNYYYIDKTMLVKEILDNGATVTLIPRPRRFGKTLNMSMLRYFFEKPVEDLPSTHIFNGLKITTHQDAMDLQGQYPVIFLSLKFTAPSTWESCLTLIKQLIADEFRRHKYLLDSDLLDVSQKQNYQNIIEGTANQDHYVLSLKTLSEYLEKYHKQKPIILIDEYDVPIHGGYMNGYYKEVVSFIKSFFGNGMKDNLHLNFAVITGVLRVAKESIFTGMNNLEVCDFPNHAYADKFGLLEDEVKEILKYYELEDNLDEVRDWYNGYTSGKFKVYNPWSIINLVKQGGKLVPYWVNTGSTDIIKDIIRTGTKDLKNDLNILMSGGKITKPLCHDIVYSEIFSNDDALWNFLFFTGYLTFQDDRMINNVLSTDFFIPNQEIKTSYFTTISTWFKTDSTRIYNEILQNLIAGNVERFAELFTKFVMNSFSFFDVGGDEPERFYHAFVLGMVVSLSSTYEIRSNRESGTGYYDVMLIPKDRNKYGIIMEFKNVNTYRKETIEEAAQRAMDQIITKKYDTELHALGIKKIVQLGIAFEGKQVFILSK